MNKKDQYFRLNKTLLLIVGLWPYQQSLFTTFQYIFISTILISFVACQLTTFLTLKCTLELFLKVFCPVSFFVVILIKYNLFYFRLKSVKNLLMLAFYVQNELKDKNEIAIIKKYDCISRRFTVGLTSKMATCSICGVNIMQFWLYIFHINLLPANVSRFDHLPFEMEYFIDKRKYIYLITLHVCAAVCVGPFVLMAIGAMMIAYIHFTCGMFTIASYRIKNAINFNIQKRITSKSKIWMTEGIICGINIHRQAIKFVFLMTTFTMWCDLLKRQSVSNTLFQLVSSKNDIGKFYLSFMISSACTVYMFLANLMGQIVIDHNNNVYTTAYNAQWFKTPLHMQKMILFILQRRTKDFSLNIGGLFDASMEGFSTLVKASVTYFTVMHSTR
ncbi:uncharacterized protein [Cardiocondyla obscurior]|uniref:uncharacterized protein n=1 Tax=Cardiocondyla obscurior TaxID=286306 RepID=UPI0039656D8A